MNTPSKTPKSSFDGQCIYASPSQRVLNDFFVTGNANMTIKNCKDICQGQELIFLETNDLRIIWTQQIKLWLIDSNH